MLYYVAKFIELGNKEDINRLVEYGLNDTFLALIVDEDSENSNPLFDVFTSILSRRSSATEINKKFFKKLEEYDVLPFLYQFRFKKNIGLICALLKEALHDDSSIILYSTLKFRKECRCLYSKHRYFKKPKV